MTSPSVPSQKPACNPHPLLTACFTSSCKFLLSQDPSCLFFLPSPILFCFLENNPNWITNCFPPSAHLVHSHHMHLSALTTPFYNSPVVMALLPSFTAPSDPAMQAAHVADTIMFQRDACLLSIIPGTCCGFQQIFSQSIFCCYH